MAKYIDREALVEWLKRIPLKDLSDGLGLCRVIMEDDFKKAIKKMPKGIVADVAPVRHGRWVKQDKYAFGTFYDCACRHLAKYQCGLDDEDHLAAAAFNVLGAMLMENTMPEMQDLPKRNGKKTFGYFRTGVET